MLMYIRIALALLGLSFTAACVDDSTPPVQALSLTAGTLPKSTYTPVVKTATQETAAVAPAASVSTTSHWATKTVPREESRYSGCRNQDYHYVFTFDKGRDTLSYRNTAGTNGQVKVDAKGVFYTSFTSYLTNSLSLEGNAYTRVIVLKNGSCWWDLVPIQ